MAEWQGTDGLMSAQVLRCAEPQPFTATWTVTLLAANSLSTWDATYTVYSEVTGFQDDADFYRTPAPLPNFVTSEVRCPDCAEPTVVITCPNAAGTVPAVIEATNGIFATITPGPEFDRAGIELLAHPAVQTVGPEAGYLAPLYESGEYLEEEEGFAAEAGFAASSYESGEFESEEFPGAGFAFDRQSVGEEAQEAAAQAGAGEAGAGTEGEAGAEAEAATFESGDVPAPGFIANGVPAEGLGEAEAEATEVDGTAIGTDGTFIAAEGEGAAGTGGAVVDGEVINGPPAVARPVNTAAEAAIPQATFVTAGAERSVSLKKGLMVLVSLGLAALL
ncbi:hypothetical protein QBC35DRAFT_31777 [Podospora australis]|uniref:Uncharacterized protein n=1 Tax=Podospora australis TaxID=1536484 RepID=A0AAN7ADY6_9PEZI|nr:hypothetical protein QBC35DRAFT_31777 [Podospora australis]